MRKRKREGGRKGRTFLSRASWSSARRVREREAVSPLLRCPFEEEEEEEEEGREDEVEVRE